MAKKPLAPRQARSRESERRLLQAAVEVLSKHGLEGTTIPRIAEHAGLTPGAVYRRFPDKTALLETALLKILESDQERLKRTLTPELARKHTLPALLDALIASLIESYRFHASALHGMRQLLQTTDHQAFRNKVLRIEKRSLEYMVEVLLVYRQDIRHPEPQLALSFTLVTLISSLLERFLVDVPLGAWSAFVPEDDVSLRRELKRMFLRYLGCDGS
jgi:AcrR family transcriptional regulator